jgi:hypothetical protein
MQRASRIAICGLFGSTTFFDIFSKRHDFREKTAEQKMCVFIFATTFI